MTSTIFKPLIVAPIVATEHAAANQPQYAVMILMLGVLAVAYWGWRRWQRWRHIVARACPICRRHPDAEFVDCRKGDCVTGRLWKPGRPWPPQDEEESYV